MISLFYTITNSFLFFLVFKILNLNYSFKMAQNFTSGIHLFLSLTINLLYLFFNRMFIYLIGVVFTTGHYLFDTFYLLTYKKMSLMTAALVYHHLATIYYISHNPRLYLGHIVLILAEISNIPALFIYHYLKSNPNSPNLQFWKNAQKYIYILIRIPLLIIVAYFIWINTFNLKLMLVCSPVYLMGIIWSIKLLFKS